jgi:hypothetical protein
VLSSRSVNAFIINGVPGPSTPGGPHVHEGITAGPNNTLWFTDFPYSKMARSARFFSETQNSAATPPSDAYLATLLLPGTPSCLARVSKSTIEAWGPESWRVRLPIPEDNLPPRLASRNRQRARDFLAVGQSNRRLRAASVSVTPPARQWRPTRALRRRTQRAPPARLLVLHTATGGDAERLYEHLGWLRGRGDSQFCLIDPMARPCGTQAFTRACDGAGGRHQLSGVASGQQSAGQVSGAAA